MRSARRTKLQGAHTPFAHVCQPVQYCDGALFDAFGSHPCVDECIAEVIRQSVGQHRGKAEIRRLRKCGESECLAAIREGHRQRRQFYALPLPRWLVLEGVASERWVCCCGSYPLAPYEHFNDIDGLHRFLSRDPVDWRTRRLAFELRSRAKGLTDGLGANNSRPSKQSRAFRTRSSDSTVDPRPASRFLSAFSDIPAFSAVVI